MSSLLPAARYERAAEGRCSIGPSGRLVLAEGGPRWADDVADLLAQLWAPRLGRRIARTTQPATVGDVELVVARPDISDHTPPALPEGVDEAYRLEIDASVRLTAGSREGMLHGVHALWQLLDGDSTLPRSLIQDGPALAWRGFMLDVARHFMPKSFVLKVIDAMALVRLNRLHLHLTDDQGWRLEVEGYPRLTTVGAVRSRTIAGHGSRYRDGESPVYEREHGGFYSREDIAEIVAYADRHGIVVVPEIDMPGHMSAALAAYPELGVRPGLAEPQPGWGIFENVLNLEDGTVEFVRAVVGEVVRQFPGPWVHLGGDECPTVQWADDPRTHELMRERGIESVDQVQNWILAQAGRVLTDHDRRLVGWDELVEHGQVAGEPLLMAWRDAGQVMRVLRAGYSVVAAPQEWLYLDYYQSADTSQEPLAIGGCTTLRDVYDATLVPAQASAQERSRIIGAQAQLWTEYIPTPADAAYMAFPRLWAFAENAWGTASSAGETSDPDESYAGFVARLRANLPHLRDLGLGWRPLDDAPGSQEPD